MNLMLTIFAILNLVFIILFILTTKIIFKMYNKPQLMAGCSVMLVVLFLFYFISIIVISLFAIFEQKYAITLLSLFLFIPYMIGKKATYERLGFYSNMQILALVASLSLSLALIKY